MLIGGETWDVCSLYRVILCIFVLNVKKIMENQQIVNGNPIRQNLLIDWSITMKKVNQLKEF